MASKIIGIMIRHDDGDREYYEPQFTEEDMKVIYQILDKYGDNNESKRGELEVVDMSERIDRLFNAMRSEIGVMAEYGDNEDQLKEELSTCGEEILREYERRYLKMNEREYIIGKAKELGITAEELGIEPEVRIKRDMELVEEIRELIDKLEIDPEDARAIISEEYWDDLGIPKKKYKLVKVRLSKTIYKNITVAMPEDEDTGNVDDYVEYLDNLDTDYPEDEDDWEIDDYETEDEDLTKEEVERYGQDEIWNYNDFDEE